MVGALLRQRAAAGQRHSRAVSGVARDNCANNTRVVGEHLRLHRVDCQLPLLLSINEADINNDLIRQAMQDLEAHRCRVHCIERKSCALAHHC